MTAGAVAVTALSLGLAAAPAAAQGRISNATIETRQAAGALEREVQAAGARGKPTWIGYRTPMIPGRRQMCCVDSIPVGGDCCGVCRLESGGGVTMTSGDTDRRGSRV